MFMKQGTDIGDIIEEIVESDVVSSPILLQSPQIKGECVADESSSEVIGRQENRVRVIS